MCPADRPPFTPPARRARTGGGALLLALVLCAQAALAGPAADTAAPAPAVVVSGPWMLAAADGGAAAPDGGDDGDPGDEAEADTSPDALNAELVAAGGQMHALGVFCGKTTPAEVTRRVGSLRESMGRRGMAAGTFDQIYDRNFASMNAKIKAQPEQAKQACVQLETMGQAMEAELKKKGMPGR